MGGFHRVEDRPTPKEVYNYRVYGLAVVCAMGAVTFGYDGAFIGTTIARASFKEAMGINNMTAKQQTANTTNLTSTFTGSAWFGAVFAWPMMEAWGRKRPMQVSALLFNIGAILMTVTTHNLNMIYAGRAITGFSVGILTATIPTFISEFSPPPIRGQLTGFFEIAYQLGSLIGFWTNVFISRTQVDSNKAWRTAMALQLIPGGMLAIGSVILKESPGWLLRKGREDAALENLSWIRKLPMDHHYLQEEVALLRIVIDEERKLAGGQTGVVAYLRAFARECRVPSIRHRMIILFCIFILMNFSGAVVLNYYSPTLFGAIGVATSNIQLYTGYYGLVKAFGAITFCMWGVDRLGRRKPWMWSAGSCAVCLIYVGVYVKIANPTKGVAQSTSQYQGGQAAVAMIMLYSFFWSWGGNSLAWIVSAEMFPISMRSITGAFGAATQWLSSFAATMSAPHMQAKVGWGIFVFYGACCFATLIFTYVFIPETKGVPIESMGVLFGGPCRYSQWRQKKVFPPDGMPPSLLTGAEVEPDHHHKGSMDEEKAEVHHDEVPRI